MPWEIKDANGKAYLDTGVGGEPEEIKVGAEVVKLVVATAKKMGLGQVRVFIGKSDDVENLKEVANAADAPAKVTEGMYIRVRPFDTAGIVG